MVPKCDKHDSTYYQPWLHYVLPGKRNEDGAFVPSACQRYVLQNDTSVYFGEANCPDSLFVKHMKERCYDFVYDTHERTIVQEVNSIISLSI